MFWHYIRYEILNVSAIVQYYTYIWTVCHENHIQIDECKYKFPFLCIIREVEPTLLTGMERV